MAIAGWMKAIVFTGMPAKQTYVMIIFSQGGTGSAEELVPGSRQPACLSIDAGLTRQGGWLERIPLKQKARYFVRLLFTGLAIVKNGHKAFK